jgi:sigma-B regulation protein RsbU (phosphoserine phosphatase)
MAVTLMGDSTPLGHAVDLEEGDVVLMLTDWAIEIQSPDGELFGVSRAIECVSANRDRSAREIIDCLYETVLAFSQSETPEDDVTAVVLKVGENGAATT